MLGALIGAGASLLGGVLGNKSKDKAQQQEYKRQKEFAQSGIQWKVQDAEKAGIHPLYALGAQTSSYAPQSVGGSDYSFLGDAGQNIGRAIDSTRSQSQRAQALAQTAAQIQIEGLQLDNDIKRAQLASSMALTRQPGSGPAFQNPSTMPGLSGLSGQGDTLQIDGPTLQVEKKISPITPGQPHAELGIAPEVGWYRTANGGIAPMVPESLSESFEQDWPSFYQWYYRNKVVPVATPPEKPRPGYYWKYNPIYGEYTQVPRYELSNPTLQSPRYPRNPWNYR